MNNVQGALACRSSNLLVLMTTSPLAVGGCCNQDQWSLHFEWGARVDQKRATIRKILGLFEPHNLCQNRGGVNRAQNSGALRATYEKVGDHIICMVHIAFCITNVHVCNHGTDIWGVITGNVISKAFTVNIIFWKAWNLRVWLLSMSCFDIFRERHTHFENIWTCVRGDMLNVL